MTTKTTKPQATYEEVLQSIGDALEHVHPRNNEVLVGIYIKPEKTASGLYLTDKTRDEDRWQGKAAFVLKKGPTAFVDAPENGLYFHDQNVQPGDVVIYRVSDGFPLDINGVACRLMEDVSIRAHLTTNPSIIY